MVVFFFYDTIVELSNNCETLHLYTWLSEFFLLLTFEICDTIGHFYQENVFFVFKITENLSHLKKNNNTKLTFMLKIFIKKNRMQNIVELV